MENTHSSQDSVRHGDPRELSHGDPPFYQRFCDCLYEKESKTYKADKINKGKKGESARRLDKIVIAKWLLFVLILLIQI